MYSKSSVSGFGHFVEWLLALGLYRLVRGAMLMLLLTGAACLHSHKAALQRVPLVAARERPLAQRLAGADLVVTATLAKTERDWRYEEPCGVLRSLMYGCADIPKAYQATLRRGAETRSEEHTSELQSQSNLVCRLLLEKKKKQIYKS